MKLFSLHSYALEISIWHNVNETHTKVLNRMTAIINAGTTFYKIYQHFFIHYLIFLNILYNFGLDWWSALGIFIYLGWWFCWMYFFLLFPFCLVHQWCGVGAFTHISVIRMFILLFWNPDHKGLTLVMYLWSRYFFAYSDCHSSFNFMIFFIRKE